MFFADRRQVDFKLTDPVRTLRVRTGLLLSRSFFNAKG